MPNDSQNLDSVLAHVEAAKAAPNRKEQELQQAVAFAKLIQDSELRAKADAAIAGAS
jgi:hypothetical protein